MFLGDGESFKRCGDRERGTLKKSVIVRCVSEGDVWPGLSFPLLCLRVCCLGLLPAPCHCHLAFPPRPCDHGQESETESKSSFALYRLVIMEGGMVTCYGNEKVTHTFLQQSPLFSSSVVFITQKTNPKCLSNSAQIHFYLGGN